MQRRHTFIKDGVLTITTVGIFCFLFLIANAYQGDTKSTDDQSLLTEVENEKQALQTSNHIQNNFIVNVEASDSPLLQEEAVIKTEPREIAKEDTEPEAIFTEPVAVDTNVEVEKEIIEKKVVGTSKTIQTKVRTLPKVVTATKPAVANGEIKLTQSERSDTDTEYINQITKHIEQKTNAFRIDAGLLPLSHDKALENNAKVYSEAMQDANLLSHTSTDGCGLTCRFARDGYKAYSWGENLAMMSYNRSQSAEEVASFFMSMWKKSAGHKENLISPLFTNQGIGIAVSPTSVYVTVHFAKP